MSFVVKTTMMLVLWAAGLYGVLQMHRIDALDIHGICGPWGCGPPVAALISWHGFSLLLAAPIVVLLVRVCSAISLRRIGLAAVSGGVPAIVSVGIWQAVTWLPQIQKGQPSYFVQRYLFTIITMVDVPIIPVTLAGVAAVVGAKVKGQETPIGQVSLSQNREVNRQDA